MISPGTIFDNMKTQASTNSLKIWFTLKSKLLLAIYGVMFLFAFGVIFSLYYLDKKQSTSQDLNEIGGPIQQAIMHQNRGLIESLLESFILKKPHFIIALCDAEEAIIQPRGDQNICKTASEQDYSFFFEKKLQGFNDYKLVAATSNIFSFLPNGSVLLLCFSIFIFGGLLLAALLRTIYLGMILPLETGLEDYDADLKELNIIKDKLKLSRENEVNAKLVSLARQLSHDIRSPLAALEMLSSSISNLPTETQLLLRNSINRIREIADSLLNRKSPQHINLNHSEDTDEGSRITVLLAPLIEEILSEKRIRYKHSPLLNISFIPAPEHYQIFAHVNPAELKRILSNLLDNAAEAIPDLNGTVKVYLETRGGDAEIKIKDTGLGIPEHWLPLLGQKGATFGKSNGNGLGLFHAKEQLNRWGGKLSISSNNQGTTVMMTIPVAPTPQWHLERINSESYQQVIIIDDDRAIHSVWNKLWEQTQDKQLTFFTSLEEFKNFYRACFHELPSETIFLFDYEFSETKTTGLDTISQLGIEAQSVLVTSHYNEPAILEKCTEMSIKIIPKPLLHFLPL